MTCDRCGHAIEVGDFPFCKGQASDHVGGRFGVTPDDIPGGIDIRHGLCNPDGSPRRYYSKTEIAKEAARRGYTNHVEHIDGSKHTSRWI